MIAVYAQMPEKYGMSQEYSIIWERLEDNYTKKCWCYHVLEAFHILEDAKAHGAVELPVVGSCENNSIRYRPSWLCMHATYTVTAEIAAQVEREGEALASTAREVSRDPLGLIMDLALNGPWSSSPLARWAEKARLDHFKPAAVVYAYMALGGDVQELLEELMLQAFTDDGKPVAMECMVVWDFEPPRVAEKYSIFGSIDLAKDIELVRRYGIKEREVMEHFAFKVRGRSRPIEVFIEEMRPGKGFNLCSHYTDLAERLGLETWRLPDCSGAGKRDASSWWVKGKLKEIRSKPTSVTAKVTKKKTGR